MSRSEGSSNPDQVGEIWSLVEKLNSSFDYGDQGQDLEFWANMLESQVEEIRQHIENEDNRKARNEFADAIFVAAKALMEGDPDYQTTIKNRALDVMSRTDEIQSEYSEGNGYKLTLNQDDSG